MPLVTDLKHTVTSSRPVQAAAGALRSLHLEAELRSVLGAVRTQTAELPERAQTLANAATKQALATLELLTVQGRDLLGRTGLPVPSRPVSTRAATPTEGDLAATPTEGDLAETPRATRPAKRATRPAGAGTTGTAPAEVEAEIATPATPTKAAIATAARKAAAREAAAAPAAEDGTAGATTPAATKATRTARTTAAKQTRAAKAAAATPAAATTPAPATPASSATPAATTPTSPTSATSAPTEAVRVAAPVEPTAPVDELPASLEVEHPTPLTAAQEIANAQAATDAADDGT